LYVGKGSNRRAWGFSGGRRNQYWERLKEKYGEPRVKIVYSGLSEHSAHAAEASAIRSLKYKGKILCNLTDGGEGTSGFFPGAETRAKLSKINSGENNNMFGKTHSDEARKRISEAHKGKYLGESSVRYNPEVKTLVHVNGSEFRGTRREAWSAIGHQRSAWSMLFSGRIKSYKGWRLEGLKESDVGKATASRHWKYDHTIYNFVHADGTKESCTRFELCKKYNLKHASNVASLCKRRLKSYKGWRLLSPVDVDD
jgi:hypothetical protein